MNLRKHTENRKGVIFLRVKKSALWGFIRSRGSVTFREIEAFFQKKRYRFQGDTIMRLSDIIVWRDTDP